MMAGAFFLALNKRIKLNIRRKAVYLQQIINFNNIIMETFNFIMAIALPALKTLLFMVEIVYYVVKTVKELS